MIERMQLYTSTGVTIDVDLRRDAADPLSVCDRHGHDWQWVSDHTVRCNECFQYHNPDHESVGK